MILVIVTTAIVYCNIEDRYIDEYFEEKNIEKTLRRKTEKTLT